MCRGGFAKKWRTGSRKAEKKSTFSQNPVGEPEVLDWAEDFNADYLRRGDAAATTEFNRRGTRVLV